MVLSASKLASLALKNILSATNLFRIARSVAEYNWSSISKCHASYKRYDSNKIELELPFTKVQIKHLLEVQDNCEYIDSILLRQQLSQICLTEKSIIGMICTRMCSDM